MIKKEIGTICNLTNGRTEIGRGVGHKDSSQGKHKHFTYYLYNKCRPTLPPHLLIT